LTTVTVGSDFCVQVFQFLKLHIPSCVWLSGYFFLFFELGSFCDFSLWKSCATFCKFLGCIFYLLGHNHVTWRDNLKIITLFFWWCVGCGTADVWCLLLPKPLDNGKRFLRGNSVRLPRSACITETLIWDILRYLERLNCPKEFLRKCINIFNFLENAHCAYCIIQVTTWT